MSNENKPPADSAPRCPKCMATSSLAAERRPDGDAKCNHCGWSGPYADCFNVEMVEKSAYDRLKAERDELKRLHDMDAVVVDKSIHKRIELERDALQARVAELEEMLNDIREALESSTKEQVTAFRRIMKLRAELKDIADRCLNLDSVVIRGIAKQAIADDGGGTNA